jgi:hypothetical protein
VSDDVSVTITGLTAGQISDDAFVGVYLPSDALQSSALTSNYIGNLRDKSTWTFAAPKDYGTYEIRVFTSSVPATQRASVLFAKAQFTVGSKAAKDGDITLNKSTFLTGESITAVVHGLTAGQISDDAYAGIYLPSDVLASSSYNGTSTYMSNLRDDMTWTFNAPMLPGKYEVRVFTKGDSTMRDQSIFGIVSFTVKASATTYRINVAPAKSLTVNKNKSALIRVLASPKDGGAAISANSFVTFKSANPKIASVNAQGIVMGRAKGQTTVVVSFGAQKKSIQVIVK